MVISRRFPAPCFEKIVTEHLDVQKIVRHVVAKATDIGTQSKAYEVSIEFLQRYHEDDDEFLDQIITGNET